MSGSCLTTKENTGSRQDSYRTLRVPACETTLVSSVPCWPGLLQTLARNPGKQTERKQDNEAPPSCCRSDPCATALKTAHYSLQGCSTSTTVQYGCLFSLFEGDSCLPWPGSSAAILGKILKSRLGAVRSCGASSGPAPPLALATCELGEASYTCFLRNHAKRVNSTNSKRFLHSTTAFSTLNQVST